MIRDSNPRRFREIALVLWVLGFGALTATLAQAETAAASAYEKGVAQKRLMSNAAGKSAADPLLAEVSKVAPDLERFAHEFVFGQVLSRPGLDIQQREIATLAALTALGAEQELQLHVGTALDVGLKKEQIVEVLLQQVVYSGFPRAINALLVAKGVFEKRGL